jgi:hypothetical protein
MQLKEELRAIKDESESALEMKEEKFRESLT